MRARTVRVTMLGILFVLATLASTPLIAQGDLVGAYRLGVSDRIQIRVAELPDIDIDTEIREDGTISLPIVGTLRARDLSETELAERIRNELIERGVRQATVTVRVIEFHGRPVSILGAVRTPGNVPVRGPARLFDLLIRAGGLTDNAGERINVFRQAENGLSAQLEIRVEDLIRLGDPTVNIPVLAGDRINVPVARKLTYYFLGAVETAGQQSFSSNEGVTLLTAIARVGGLSETASPKVRVLRTGADGQRQEIVANYQRILDGRDPDITIEDGDIIVVKESFF